MCTQCFSSRFVTRGHKGNRSTWQQKIKVVDVGKQQRKFCGVSSHMSESSETLKQDQDCFLKMGRFVMCYLFVTDRSPCRMGDVSLFFAVAACRVHFLKRNNYWRDFENFGLHSATKSEGTHVFGSAVCVPCAQPGNFAFCSSRCAFDVNLLSILRVRFSTEAKCGKPNVQLLQNSLLH